MYDPIMRVLTLLEILQSRDHVSGAELSAQLEVDLRTIQRYVSRLRDLGVPVDASPGVGGSYRLRPGYRLPPLMFTNEEAFALSLGLQALRQIGLAAFAPATGGALAKLERVLPHALREGLHVAGEAIAMEPNRWVEPTSMRSLLDSSAAIHAGRRVRFRYLSHGKTTSHREVEPYAVLRLDERWYLVGRCLTREALRTFRLDRVAELEITPQTFSRPENFDARRHLAETMPFIQAEFVIDVWVDLPLAEAQGRFALWRVAMEGEGTGTRLRCMRDGLGLFAAVLLSLGCRIVVYAPDQLRVTFRQLARAALAAAADPPAGEPGDLAQSVDEELQA